MSDGGDSRPGSDSGISRLLRYESFLDRMVDFIGRWTSWLALALVLLVGFNVILRYLFQIGPVALQELEWHLLSPIALIGCAYALRHDRHVRVDIFYESFGPRTRHLVDLAASLALITVAAVVIAKSLEFVEQAYTIGEESPDPGGLPYRFLLKAFIPLGFALLLLQALAHAARHCIQLLGGRRDG